MGCGQTTDRGVPMTRRELLGAVPVAMAVGSGVVAAVDGRPRIAAIVTEYRHKSHAQGIVDRFLDGYAWDGRHYRPSLDVALPLRRSKAAGRTFSRRKRATATRD